MLRGGVLPALVLLFIWPGASAGAAGGRQRGPDATVFDMPLPGGLQAAMAAVDDRAAPDRSQFLAELIRRIYNTPPLPTGEPRTSLRRTLVEHLARQRGASAAPDGALPLPLHPSVWIDVVFGGTATERTLAERIVASQAASLLYCGLLTLDDPTRAWLAGERDLLAEIATTYPAEFLAAAPGLRVEAGRVRVPGGERAEASWNVLANAPPSDPARFVRALLAGHGGRLAYFYGSMSVLTPARAALALGLERSEADRLADARRLLDVFVRLAPGWRLGQRAFWRPLLDPALLAAEVASGADGRPSLPGTRSFWADLFADQDGRPGAEYEDARVAAWLDDAPVEFAWICEEVFRDPARQEALYQAVLFASRMLDRLTTENARAAYDAVRSAIHYPALAQTLERAKLRDVTVFAAGAGRADAISTIRDRARARLALAQFQGALALLTRAALRGSISTHDLARHVVSLSAVPLGTRGEYEGRLAGWMRSVVVGGDPPHALDPSSRHPRGGDRIEGRLLEMLAGAVSRDAVTVEWEGTRYRLDFASAEALRLARVLGGDLRSFLSVSAALVDAADAIEREDFDPERLRRVGSTLEDAGRAAGWEGRRAPEGYHGLLEALARGGGRDRPRLASRLRATADHLLAGGLTELAYAVALGDPERLLVPAAEIARRHDFGLRVGITRRSRPWQLPGQDAPSSAGWRMTGSLLGLDVQLADFSLVQISSKPPPAPPTLNEQDRRALVEAVALVRAADLTDIDRDTIASALRRGRAALEGLDAPGARELGDKIGLDPARRTVLAWVAARDRDRLRHFLSPLELLRLGLDGRPAPPGLHAWGAPARPIIGCLCLQLPGRSVPGALAGRSHGGLLAASFPDLNLRLAELLAELHMPAPLLAPVLAPATLELVNTALARDPDDRRGLVEFVQALRAERVEQYLALLTTGGPLVPEEEARAGSAGAGLEVVP